MCAVYVAGVEGLTRLLEIGANLGGGFLLRAAEGATDRVEAAFGGGNRLAELTVEVTGISGGELAEGADDGIVRGRRGDNRLFNRMGQMVAMDGGQRFLVDILVGLERLQRDIQGVIGEFDVGGWRFWKTGDSWRKQFIRSGLRLVRGSAGSQKKGQQPRSVPGAESHSEVPFLF